MKMDKNKRKELAQEYKLQELTGGVYKIWNTKTGTSYIKGDTNLAGSKNRFDFSQKMGSCVVLSLNKEWNEYGSEAFAFEILEEIKMKQEETEGAFRDRLKHLEEEWKEKEAYHRVSLSNTLRV